MQAETFHGKSWFEADPQSHGYSGPLHTEPHDLAPISNLLVDSFVDQGLPLHHDMFSTGDVCHGVGHAPRTVHKGIRTTSADFVTNEYHRPNVDIQTDATVDRVVLEPGADGDGLRATGALVRTADGTARTFHAKKEVIVSAGAYCSPAILKRSGLGPRDELEDLGIECQLELPGVGRNLMDHMVGSICIYLYTEHD